MTKQSSGEKPQIKETIKDTTQKLGEMAELSCLITGKPIPEVAWFR